MYPLSKYKFYVRDKKREVIAVSTYAGRAVRGIAKCHENDEFDLEKGKELAALRCALKVAKQRRLRAERKCYEAEIAADVAVNHLHKMEDYFDDACDEVDEVEEALEDFRENL